MTARVKLVAQGLAVALVAGMLALLVWKVAHDKQSNIPSALAAGKRVDAPDFELAKLTGEGRLALDDLRGKVVVLNFWASWCPPCKEETPRLQALWQKYRSRGAVVLGIDTRDVRRDALGFMRKHRITYPNVQDGPGALWDDYAITAVPETFIVDRQGRLVARIVGVIKEDDVDGVERQIEGLLA